MDTTGPVDKPTQFVRRGLYVVLDLFGPTVEFLTLPEEPGAAYCVTLGTIPPGVSVPLHSHPDPESFYVLSGALRALCQEEDSLDWRNVQTGDFVHVPGNRKHSWQNVSSTPAL